MKVAILCVLIAGCAASDATPEHAVVRATSPVPGHIYVTLMEGGARSPYDLSSPHAANGALILVGGIPCDVAGAWAVGTDVVLRAGDCQGRVAAGASVQLRVVVARAVVLEERVEVMRASEPRADAAENAGVNVQSPSSGVIQVVLVRAGENAPYNVATADGAPNNATVAINGETCVPADMGGSGATDTWDAGEVIRLVNSANAADTPASCPFSPGTTVTVTVAVAGTVIFDNAVRVKA